jgi:hypothetical protein
VSMFLGALAAVSTAFPPLIFDEIQKYTNVKEAKQIECVAYPSRSCSLTRSAISNVPIENSNIWFNETTFKPINLFVTFDHPIISELLLLGALKEKYGKPTSDVRKQELNEQGGPFESRVVSWEA